jgi:chromosome segregation ATPase
MTDQNLQRLAKVKAAIAKLGTPVTPADKAKLAQMVSGLTTDVQKAVPMARVWQKDRDTINAAKKKVEEAEELGKKKIKEAEDLAAKHVKEVQKKVDEAIAKMNKYQGELLALQQKINSNAETAYNKAKELDDAAKKASGGKAIKELVEIEQLLWDTEEDFASFVRWASDA